MDCVPNYNHQKVLLRIGLAEGRCRFMKLQIENMVMGFFDHSTFGGDSDSYREGFSRDGSTEIATGFN